MSYTSQMQAKMTCMFILSVSETLPRIKDIDHTFVIKPDVNTERVITTCLKHLCLYSYLLRFVLWCKNGCMKQFSNSMHNLLTDVRLHKFGYSVLMQVDSICTAVFSSYVPPFNWISKVELETWATMPWQIILKEGFYVSLRRRNTVVRIVDVWDGKAYQVSDRWFMMHLRVFFQNGRSTRVTLRDITNSSPSPHTFRPGKFVVENHTNNIVPYISRIIPKALRPYPCPLIQWGKREHSVHVLFCRRNVDGSSLVLLQHRALQKWAIRKQLTQKQLLQAGQDVLGLPGGGASRGEVCPEITAWRECSEECFNPCEVLRGEFFNAIDQKIVDKSHVLYIVDVSKLRGIPEDWCGPSHPDPKEISTFAFGTGHLWATEEDVDIALRSESPHIQGIPVWSHTIDSLRTCRDAFRRPGAITLYHGTSREAAKVIIENGFILEDEEIGCQRKSWKCSNTICCCAGMMGKGVYLAELPKGQSNAGRCGVVQGEVVIGTVLKCEVNLGRCKIAASCYKCSCGCGTPQADHLSKWKLEGYDSVKVPAKTISKRAEWCIADVANVKPVAYQDVRWSINREFIDETKFIDIK